MASVKSETISRVIGGIYDAAYDPSHWLQTIEQLRVLFHGSRACFAKMGPGTDASDAVPGPDPEFVRRYIEEHAQDNNILADAVHAAPIGLVYNDHALVGQDRLKRSRFWNDWMAPQDMYGGIACKLLESEANFWFFDVQRGRRQSAFDVENIKLLHMLTPHLKRATGLSHRLRQAQTQLSAFASLPFGALLVDRDLRVISMNAAADAIMARPGSALRVKAGSLSATDSAAAAGLRSLVGDACPVHNGIAGSGGDILVRGGQDIQNGNDVMVSVGPLPGSDAFGLPMHHAVIFIQPLTLALPDGFEDRIRHLFDLSPAEARLAAALAGGMALKDAASRHGIQFSTARSYLDSIFRKTGTHQQSQLVALLKNAQLSIR